MASQEELQAVTIKIVAELHKLEILEPESDKTLARVFELLKLVDKDPVKQAMLLARTMGIRPGIIAMWMLKKNQPTLSERKKLIAGLRKLLESRRLS